MVFLLISMPFTLSHAVLAPPLVKLSGNRLPLAALAVGCMVPDLIRLFNSQLAGSTHQWSAMIYPNLWIGLGFTLLWYVIYRPALYRFLGIQKPLNLHTPVQVLLFLFASCLAIMIGTATHILWDGLTHVDGRTFAFHHFLSQKVTLWGAVYPMHMLLQIGSSIVALPVLGGFAWRYYQRYRQYRPVSSKIKRYFWSMFILAFCLGSWSVFDYLKYFDQALIISELYYFTGKSINEFSQAALTVLSLGCMLFLFLDRHRAMD